LFAGSDGVMSPAPPESPAPETDANAGRLWRDLQRHHRANFDNPTGDMRSGQFLVPTTLRGGGFPRQFQLGLRFGF
jgi:hypothetical protein